MRSLVLYNLGDNLRTVIRRAQIVLVLRYFLHRDRVMDGMNLEHALACFRRFPSCATEAVHLRQDILMGGVAPLDVEGHGSGPRRLNSTM